jgi:hypothetical protein
MTNLELSNEFDVLYNNIMSNQAPGLDEYEKSVFLTKAQDEIVKAYFNPRLNKPQEGFDANERRQIDFSMIMRSKKYTSDFGNSFFDYRDNTKSVTLDKDILMFVNEYVEVNRNGIANEKETEDEKTTFTGGNTVRLTVVPINYTEYSRLMSKPYKRPLHYQAWRILDNSGSDEATVSTSEDTILTQPTKRVELVIGPNDTLISYVVRYVKRPRAIRLIKFDEVTLDGSSEEQTCELDPILHHEILQRAVELAKAAYTGDLNSQVALGQTSQTNLGVVTQASR